MLSKYIFPWGRLQASPGSSPQRGISNPLNKGFALRPTIKVDSQTIFISLSLVQESLSLGSHATEISIRLKDEDRLAKIKESIQSKLRAINSNYNVFTYIELASDFIEFSKTRARIQAIIPLIMLLIATLGIVNPMLMAVLERTHEIVIIKSMGMRDRGIVSLILTESFFIGIIGATIGGAIGSGLSILTEKTGIDYSWPWEK